MGLNEIDFSVWVGSWGRGFIGYIILGALFFTWNIIGFFDIV